MTVTALEPDGDLLRTLAAPEGPLRLCDDAADDACNWLTEADGALCLACRHNRTIPDLTVPDLTVPLNLQRWTLLERAKHHLFYSLLRLNSTLKNRTDDPQHGLAFDFLAAAPDAAAPNAKRWDVISGTFWSATAGGWRIAARCSATTPWITPPPCRLIIPADSL